MQFDRKMLSLFWHWISERQKVFYRRKVLNVPPPWTEDPILRGTHFTNVYRELDPGTTWLLRNVLENPHYTEEESAFLVLAYRLFASEEIFTELGVGGPPHRGSGMLPASFDPGWFAATLERMLGEGRRAFTSAYMVTSFGQSGAKSTAIAQVLKDIARDWPVTWAKVRQANSRQEVHKLLTGLFGIGRFVGFQALVDYCYPLNGTTHAMLPFNNNQWVAAGPGAMKGLKFLMPSATAAQDDALIAKLVAEQVEPLKRLDMPWLMDHKSRPILVDRSNMQNCLCEFSKYVRLQELNGRPAGRSGRKFAETPARTRDTTEVRAKGPEVSYSRFSVQIDAFNT